MAHILLNAVDVLQAANKAIKALRPPPNTIRIGSERELGLVNEVRDAASWVVDHPTVDQRIALSLHEVSLIGQFLDLAKA